MSSSPINPGDLIGGLIGGLLSQNQGANNPFDLGKVFGDFLGEPQETSASQQTDKQKQSAPTAGRVASDVFTAAGSAAEFIKDRFPKKAAASLAETELTEALMAMLAEHDGFENLTAGKRESLYRATAAKWAVKILNPVKTAPQDSTPRTSTEASEVAQETVIPVTTNPRVVPSAPTVKEAPVITADILDAVSGGIHLEQHPDHPEWSICKEENQVCKYNTLGRAMAILKNPEA